MYLIECFTNPQSLYKSSVISNFMVITCTCIMFIMSMTCVLWNLQHADVVVFDKVFKVSGSRALRLITMFTLKNNQ